MYFVCSSVRYWPAMRYPATVARDCNDDVAASKAQTGTSQTRSVARPTGRTINARYNSSSSIERLAPRSHPHFPTDVLGRFLKCPRASTRLDISQERRVVLL
jgi:hypothetical protein